MKIINTHFLITTIEIVNTHQAEILENPPTVKGKIVIDLRNVFAIRQDMDDDVTEVLPDSCVLYLKNDSRQFYINENFKELAEYWTAL